MKKLIVLVWAGSLASFIWASFPSFEQMAAQGMQGFAYAGKSFDFSKPESCLKLAENERYEVRKMTYLSTDGKLQLCNTWKFYKKFPAAEVCPLLRAVGSAPTEIVDGFQALKLATPTARAKIRALTGTVCTENDFTPADRSLARTAGAARSAVFDVIEGRSSSRFMPWFGVDLDDGTGLEIGLGWTGGWTARFDLTDTDLQVQAGMRKTHFRLLPGEELRQPSVLILRREKGVSVSAARTMLHRFMRAEKLPRNSRRELIKPILPITAGGGNKPDKMMLDILAWSVQHKMPFDTFWVDAAWYGPAQVPDPYPNCGSTWWPNTGDWRVNTAIHPDGNLRKVSNYAHAHGMRFLLWFEPERSMSDKPMATEHPGWMLPRDWQRTVDPKKPQPLLVNLGDAACRAYLVELISRFIRENKIDVYRQDFNLDPSGLWAGNDAPDRLGVTEAKHIAGLYAFWDELKRRFPDLLIENCASGGRRLDFEMVSRSHSYCRTDFAVGHRGTDSQVFNVQNITLNTLCYQPFQGSETTPAAMFDDYGFFSSVCAGSVFTPSDWEGGIVRRPFSEKENAWLAKVFAAADEMRTGFMGDFYPQTEPSSLAPDRWVAYQLHRSDLDRGFAIAFRRPACADAGFTFNLEGLVPEARYTVRRYNGETTTLSGTALAHLRVNVSGPRDFALVFYRRITD